MNRILIVCGVLMLGVAIALLAPLAPVAPEKKSLVLMETSLGPIKIELFSDQAPITVKNFKGYVEDRFYDGTLFHRVAKRPAVIQGGGYEPGQKEKKTRPSIKNEAGNMLSNKPYTVAMARTSDPDSATSQFYINVKDNDFLDRAKDPDHFGYCVFGKVVDGTDVVDKIANVKTEQDMPLEDVVIKTVRVVDK